MKRQIRVLRVIARLNVGGPARHVTILDRGLRSRGFDTLLTHGDIGPGEASLEQLVEASGVPSQRIRGLGRRVSLLGDMRAFVTLARLLFQFEPDVVHTHTAKAGTLGRLAAALYNASRRRERRCLVVHTFHGHVLHGYFGRFVSVVVRGIERGLGRLTDCILVLSPRQLEDIGGRYRITAPARIRVVPLGLDLEALAALPEARESAGPIVFGFVGRFVPVKNLPLLVEAFAAVHREAPDTRLLLIGDGECRDRIASRISAHGLQSAVEFSGWREDLWNVYRDIDVLVLTSLNEGTPVAVIEAMAAALPVVVTDVGGVPDVVADGSTGILVPSGSVGHLTAAMLRLARSWDLRRRMGAAGREEVQSRYAASRLVADVADLYERELRAKRGHLS